MTLLLHPQSFCDERGSLTLYTRAHRVCEQTQGRGLLSSHPLRAGNAENTHDPHQERPHQPVAAVYPIQSGSRRAPDTAPAAQEKASPQNPEGGKPLSWTKGWDSLQPGRPHTPSDFTSGTAQPLLGPLNENGNT